jgi:hypothetical protein
MAVRLERELYYSQLLKGHPSLKQNNIPQEHARRRAGSGHNVDGGHGRHDGYLVQKLEAVKV